MRLSNLGKRFLFVLWSVPLGWWLINSTLTVLPKSVAIVYPAQVAIIAIILIACFEYTRMLGIFYPRNAFWFGYIWLGAYFVLYFDRENIIPSDLSIYTLLMLVALEAFIWGKRNQRKRWVRASLFFSGIAFLSIAGTSLLSLYREPFQSLFIHPDHQMLSQVGIVIVIAAIFMCDSAAYIFGSLFGKTHFSSISPNKTVEGSVAGLTASVLVSGIGWWYLANPSYPPWLGIVLGVFIGVFAQVGDLLVSLMKRYFRVKDASDIIPGHGGILDRFDSVFFTAPVLSLFAYLVSRFFG